MVQDQLLLEHMVMTTWSNGPVQAGPGPYGPGAASLEP